MIEKLDFQDVMEYDLPLTPPTSPCNFDIDIDLQDFETSLDEIPLPYKKHDSIVIKDCMWSPEDFSSSKIREHSYTRLYIGEPPSNRTIFETPELSSKFLSSVDPAEVFPNVSCVDDRAHVRDLNSSDSGMMNFLLFYFSISFVFIKVFSHSAVLRNDIYSLLDVNAYSFSFQNDIGNKSQNAKLSTFFIYREARIGSVMCFGKSADKSVLQYNVCLHSCYCSH